MNKEGENGRFADYGSKRDFPPKDTFRQTEQNGKSVKETSEQTEAIRTKSAKFEFGPRRLCYFS